MSMSLYQYSEHLIHIKQNFVILPIFTLLQLYLIIFDICRLYSVFCTLPMPNSRFTLKLNFSWATCTCWCRHSLGVYYYCMPYLLYISDYLSDNAQIIFAGFKVFMVICIHVPFIACAVMAVAPVRAVRFPPPLDFVGLKTKFYIRFC